MNLTESERARMGLPRRESNTLYDAARALSSCAGAAEHWTEEEREGLRYLRIEIAKAGGKES